MDAIQNYANSGYGLAEIVAVLILIAGIIVCIEKCLKWIWNKFVYLYNKKKGVEDKDAILDKNTNEIQNLTVKIDELGVLLNKQYTHLEKKIDEQKDKLYQFDEDGKRRDCAILRDRILQSIRYFSKNKDEQGQVHISVTDHENLSHLFEEYFGCNGNGTVKSMYENEFQHWIIDN